MFNKFNKKRALVITSHRNNAIALTHILESLGNERDIDIIVVIGGNDDVYTVTRESNITTIHSPYNSIDYTGLLALVDLAHLPHLAHRSYFYIHDTTRAGPGFLRHVMHIPHDTVTASFRWPSMNIGLYSHEFLMNHTDTLDLFRNTDTSEDTAHTFKTKCVDFEDCLFRQNTETHVFLSNTPPEVCGAPTEYYKTGVTRLVEYYPTMDLYKIKANWMVKEKYELRP